MIRMSNQKEIKINQSNTNQVFSQKEWRRGATFQSIESGSNELNQGDRASIGGSYDKTV